MDSTATLEITPLPFELRNFGDRLGRLKQWPRRRELQLIALAWLSTCFEPGGRLHGEPGQNYIIADWHTFRDWTRLRRELCDLGYLARTSDGRRYRVPATSDGDAPQ
jgi:hypothetical protein